MSSIFDLVLLDGPSTSTSRTLLLWNAVIATALVGRVTESRTKRAIVNLFTGAFLFQLWDSEGEYSFGFKLLALAGLWASLKMLTLVFILCFAGTNGLDTLQPGKFRPLFFFGATTHARFGPVKHSFRYPLLYFGFPLDFTGKVGSLFEVKGLPVEGEEVKEPEYMLHRGFTFFSIDPTKYLDPKLPFNKKLEPILAGEVRKEAILDCPQANFCRRVMISRITPMDTLSLGLSFLATLSTQSTTIIFTMPNRS